MIHIKTIKFNEFATFIQGQNRTRLSTKYHDEESFYNSTNFEYDLNLFEDVNLTIDLNNEALNVGDIVISPNLFKAAIISEEHNNKVFDNNLIKVKLNINIIDPLYFIYLINESVEIKKQIERELQGTLIRRLSIKSLNEIEIETPKIEIQRKIGEIYKSLNNIGGLEVERIKLKNEIILQYLGEFR